MRSAILDSLSAHMNKNLKAMYPGLKVLIRQIVYETISLSPEAIELRDGGTLAFQFGLREGTGNRVVDRIATRLANSVFLRIYKVRRVRGNIKGRLAIGIIRSDYSDVANLRSGEVKTEKGVILPWLNWLLFEGDKFIIQDYGIQFGKGKGRSRGAIMLPISDKVKRVWRITPTELTGTVDDNWFTRALLRRENYLFSQVSEYIKRNF